MKRLKSNNTDISEIVTAVKVTKKLNPIAIGLFLVFISIVLFLALISYHRLDLTSWSTPRQLIDGISTHNWLGAIGANLAKFFFELFLGYPTIILPIYIFYVGWRLIRKAQSAIYYHPLFNQAFQIALLLSIILAVPESLRTGGFSVDYYPSGLIGGLFADLICRMTGKLGLIFITLFYSLAIVYFYYPAVIQYLWTVLVRIYLKIIDNYRQWKNNSAYDNENYPDEAESNNDSPIVDAEQNSPKIDEKEHIAETMLQENDSKISASNNMLTENLVEKNTNRPVTLDSDDQFKKLDTSLIEEKVLIYDKSKDEFIKTESNEFIPDLSQLTKEIVSHKETDLHNLSESIPENKVDDTLEINQSDNPETRISNEMIAETERDELVKNDEFNPSQEIEKQTETLERIESINENLINAEEKKAEIETKLLSEAQQNIQAENVEEPAHSKDLELDLDTLLSGYLNDSIVPDMNTTLQADTTEDVQKTPSSLEVKPEFTIENQVEEKKADLDKIHSGLSKRERYVFPSVDLLQDDPNPVDAYVNENELWNNAKLLEDKLLDFKVDGKVVNVVAGPVITMFELKPAIGVRLSKIETLMPEIALNMRARGIRYLGQLPSKDTVGIEIPNANPKIVYFKEIINSDKFANSKYELPVALGKAVNGEIIVRDLAEMPHLLVAGATGSGKSVGLNSIITSLLYARHPDDLKFVMIDPKMLELGLYNKLMNHHLAFSSDLDEKVITKPDNAKEILKSVVSEMETRYRYLADVHVRNLKEYNQKIAGKIIDAKDAESGVHPRLPYIVVIIDELADLMITAGKEIEEPIARLTQMARAVGIHCVIATQRPSVDVITGVIKANIPTRIAFQTASKIDSRTILDIMGAEQLLGKGDMLYLPPGSSKPVRIQNALLTTEEIESVLNHIKTQEFSQRLNLRVIKEDKNEFVQDNSGNRGAKSDVLFEEAKRLVVMHQIGSISFLQRRLSIGYSRAAKLIDMLEDEGVVGAHNGSNARDVIMKLTDLEGFEPNNLEGN